MEERGVKKGGRRKMGMSVLGRIYYNYRTGKIYIRTSKDRKSQRERERERGRQRKR